MLVQGGVRSGVEVLYGRGTELTCGKNEGYCGAPRSASLQGLAAQCHDAGDRAALQQSATHSKSRRRGVRGDQGSNLHRTL